MSPSDNTHPHITAVVGALVSKLGGDVFITNAELDAIAGAVLIYTFTPDEGSVRLRIGRAVAAPKVSQ